jgi:hypothetical protein
MKRNPNCKIEIKQRRIFPEKKPASKLLFILLRTPIVFICFLDCIPFIKEKIPKIIRTKKVKSASIFLLSKHENNHTQYMY